VIASGMDELEPDIKALVVAHFEWISSGGRRGTPASFAGRDLSGVNLSGADLSAADFSGANLSGANLKRCSFRFAKFGGATLVSVQMGRCDLRGASFRGAMMDNADLQGSSLVSMQLVDPRSGVSKGEWASDLSGVRATGASFARVDFGGASLADAVFDNADLSHARLLGCAIAGASFAGAKLEKARLPDGLSSSGEAA
jgi:uncharacterized protein YjbI with pentapeptide repeats